MPAQFNDIITSEEQLRETLGHPGQLTTNKVIPMLDKHCRQFIEHSPFLLIASADEVGNMDVSPKGDPPGFVKVLDDNTLAIPDRTGNRLAFTFLNILHNNNIALLFMIPGNRETLRVAGTAQIVRDTWIREELAINGKLPNFVTVVTVKEAFLHCAKCVLRSNLWDADQWQDISDLPSAAQTFIDHSKIPMSAEKLHDILEDDYSNNLY